MQKKPRILVVGSFVMDVIAATTQIPKSAETVYTTFTNRKIHQMLHPAKRM